MGEQHGSLWSFGVLEKTFVFQRGDRAELPCCGARHIAQTTGCIGFAEHWGRAYPHLPPVADAGVAEVVEDHGRFRFLDLWFGIRSQAGPVCVWTDDGVR